MTPKEKADKLFSKFYDETQSMNHPEDGKRKSKRLLAIAIKETQNELGKARELLLASLKDVIGVDAYFTGEILWWSHVKEEIDKL